MKLEKAWMTFGIAMFLSQVASLMLASSGFISFLVLGLFVVGCGLCFASLFKIVHHYTTSTQIRLQDHLVVKHQPETKLKVQTDTTANLEPTADNRELKVTDESEEDEWRTKLERALLSQGGD